MRQPKPRSGRVDGFPAATEPLVQLLPEPICEAWTPQRWMARRVDVVRALEQRDLAPLYTGYLPPARLEALGMVDGPAEALATAVRIFAGPEPWMSEMF